MMYISFISIFPDIYTSFLEASLIKKAQEKGILHFELLNPREFCDDKHQQIDDEIYWGGAGMLMKAKPLIDAVESVIAKYNLQEQSKNSVQPTVEWKIIFLSPSQKLFHQTIAYKYSSLDHIIFIAGRYEWIDHRFEEYMQQKYVKHFEKISIGQVVTLGGEVPSMLMTEAIVRLIPWVIKEEQSHLIESYNPDQNMHNIEYPQYTRPEQLVFGEDSFSVPSVLLNWNHAEIAKWREDNTQKIKEGLKDEF